MAVSKEQIIALLALPNMGHARVWKFINAVREDIADNELVDALNDLGFTGRKGSRYSRSDVDVALEYANGVVEDAADNGIGIVTCLDKDYPTSLKQYKNNGGESKAPLILYFRGPLSLLEKDLITVIGSRECHRSIQQSAAYIAREFVMRGFAIVSGLALGCDSAAHQGALDVHGQTVGVLAGGLADKVIYPKDNQGLAQEILARGGLLISEYAPSAQPSRYSFVQRDSIQAAVADATILIASKIDGGSMHASKECTRIAKPLYALEYRDKNAPPAVLLEGNASLIREYGAQSINAFSASREELQKRFDDIASYIRHAKTMARQGPSTLI